MEAQLLLVLPISQLEPAELLIANISILHQELLMVFAKMDHLLLFQGLAHGLGHAEQLAVVQTKSTHAVIDYVLTVYYPSEVIH